MNATALVRPFTHWLITWHSTDTGTALLDTVPCKMLYYDIPEPVLYFLPVP